ncbi:MAG: hypothetical protein BEN19_08235 [Epulopiscium sp. Nuni2H_MBin003]|nr:MAG: hypothetical protein BEN19_08235 [Epulopiscium sp. Nuni2H_MBin003]
MIYFDNAATTIKPPCVIEAVSTALATLTNANRGVNTSSMCANRAIYETRNKLAKMFNVSSPTLVIFTSGATQSLNMAILGTLKKGDHVITTNLEHNSVLRPLYYMKKKGVNLSIIKCNNNYTIDIDAVLSHIKSNTKMLVISHASNTLGVVQNLEHIGRICKEYSIKLVVDAAQTAGIISIDMQKMNIDALCLSAHKSLLAPQGLGILALSKNININPISFGGTGTHTFEQTMNIGLPESLEAGTQNGHAIVGLSAALDYINEHKIEKLYNKAHDLAKYFEQELAKIPNVIIYTNQSVLSTPVVTFNVMGSSAVDISFLLSKDYDIITRAGGLCAPLVHHMLDTTDKGIIRFSFSHNNTKQEVDIALEALKIILSKGVT